MHEATTVVYEKGMPHYLIDPPESFGFARMDNAETDDPRDYLKHMRKEGQLLGGEDTLTLSDGKKLIVITTAAASPHTSLCVPYNEFDAVWRKHAQNNGLSLSDEILIAGIGSTDKNIVPPKSVALDILTWTMLTDKDGSIIGPIDFGDLVGEKMNISIEGLKKYQLDLQHDGLKLLEFYNKFTNRLNLSTEVIEDLYNNSVRKAMPWLPEKKRHDFTSYAAIGYNRGDKVKGLEQFGYDGLGQGPQSNPMAHARCIGILRQKNFRDILTQKMADGWSYHTINDELQKNPEYFKGAVEWTPVSVLRPNGTRKVRSDLIDQPRMIENMIKQIDPYSTVAFEMLKDWLVDKLKLSSGQISAFKHHSKLTDEEWRVAEGIEILTDQPIEQSLYQINIFIGKMYDIWRETLKAHEYYMYGYELDGFKKNDIDARSQYIKQIQLNYGLPPEYVETIKQIVPTEKQLEVWNRRIEIRKKNAEADGQVGHDPLLLNAEKRLRFMRGAYKILQKNYESQIQQFEDKIRMGDADQNDLEELLQLKLGSEIFNKYNNGYNIPGVPPFGLSYHYDEGKWHIFLSPLFSKKGVAEQLSGSGLMRNERKT